MRHLALAALLLSVGVDPAAATLTTTVYASGFNAPVAFVQDPLDPQTQYVLEQGGAIRVVRAGTVLPDVFLDLSSQISSGGERGLLGLAFAPDYSTSGRFFVNFTNQGGDTVIARFKLATNSPPTADPLSRFDLQWPDGRRFIAQPFSNHNGGTVRFGPDGYLYIGMGDGGSGNDPQHNAQSPSTLLGKMLRIDVNVADDDARGYRIPPDNPFAGADRLGALDEIWAFGYRNPWKFSNDDPGRGGTGGWFVADVGQGAREEVDYEPPNVGGRNYGWRLREGKIGGANQSLPPAYTPLVDPIHDYDRSVGQSITGGYVYRGRALDPSRVGRYFFADFVAGRVFSLGVTYDAILGDATVTEVAEHTGELGGQALGMISSVDIDTDGELYIVSWSRGIVFRVNEVQPDTDHDGLPDTWERRFGLDPTVGLGSNGASGDPDADGVANLQEFLAGTHPRGFESRYLAEGATGAFFDTTLAFSNVEPLAAHLLVTFRRDDGQAIRQPIEVASERAATLDPKSLAGLQSAAFATLVESDVPVVVSRTMRWGNGRGYGAHAESAVAAAAPLWHLAEGATHSGFDLFYLVHNPNLTAVDVEVTYLRPGGPPPIVRRYPVGPLSRATIWVDLVDPALANTDVSATLRSVDGSGIVVERAMYLTRGSTIWAAGEVSLGVTQPNTAWHLAEGATGPYFDLFVLLANPSSTPAHVTLTYLRPAGPPIAVPYVVAANARLTVWVDLEQPALADTAVSTLVQSDVPIVVERAMWWPGSPPQWIEAHGSAALPALGTRWALAGGQAGGPSNATTYILVGNFAPSAGEVRVKVLFRDLAPVERRFAIAANSRMNVNVGVEFPQAMGRGFGALVESLAPASVPIAVELAQYSDAEGVTWAAGTNAAATRLQ